jgi:lipopolysaccharide export system protein LptA
LPAVGHAGIGEKADKDKPTNIEANKMSSDDARRMTIFRRQCRAHQGNRAGARRSHRGQQDADGFQFSTAYGKPVRFRQKGEPKAAAKDCGLTARRCASS